MLGLFVFLLGACLGSFFNVCIYRIPQGLSTAWPPSNCPHCHKNIRPYDNIPLLSYALLHGRCRFCHGTISPRYPLVEGLTALYFTSVWLIYGYSGLTLAYWVLGGGLIVGSFIDIDHLYLPDRLTIGGIVAGLVFSGVFPALHGAEAWWQGVLNSLLGAVTGVAILGGIGMLGAWIFRQEAMGLGDVKLLGALGAFLGWPAVLFIVAVSSFLGSFGGLILIACGRKQWRQHIPYGPYLAVAAVIWIFAGQGLVKLLIAASS